MTLQQKMRDPSGKWDVVWTSPSRDLAHILDQAVAHAVNFAREQLIREGSKNQDMVDLEDYAKKWRAFFKNVPNPDLRTIGDVYAAAEFETEHGTHAGDVLNKWLVRVLVGMYFSGVREALHGQKETHGFEYIDTAAGSIMHVYENECCSLFQRIKNRLFRKFKRLQERTY